MKVGDLITYFNPSVDGGYNTFLGLIVANDGGMIRVLLNGFKHPRWLCPTQCEVGNDGR